VVSIPDVTLSGTPSVNISAMPSVTIASIPNVTVVSIPDVTLSGTPSVNISAMPSVTIASIPNVVIGGHSLTSIPSTLTFTTAGVLYTEPFNVGQLSDYTYFVKNNAAATISVFVEVAPISAAGYFVQTPTNATPVNPSQNGLILAEYYLQYARLGVSAASTSVVEVFLQGLY
ncbi:MAG: DUF6385 domain-containing protein, partial [Turicibacter sp.]